MPTTKCPQCLEKDQADTIAIHLIDRHHWDYERARLWLRDQIEEFAFANQP